VTDDVVRCRRIARYQFGPGAGEALFPGSLEFERSRSGRVRQVFVDGDRVATLKTTGRFSLGVAGARRLHRASEPPRWRVAFDEQSVPYIEDGRSGFAAFVEAADADVRAGDEVVVTGPDDRFLAAGRAALSAEEMADLDDGVAVRVR
jgi:uncharacterized protein with predicted RNA binding PUA domain